MPIVAHSELPTFEVLRARGEQILRHEEAVHQDIRQLHIGLLNMMPDAALKVTEQQYLRLLGSANQIVQLYVHPFTVPGLARSPETQDHIERYYTPFEQLQRDGLDGLIISGANVTEPNLALEGFWEPLREVISWAREHVTSVLCSCLATHALLKLEHGIERRPLQAKRWGVYEHRASHPNHPLLRGTNTRFDVPHSRWNEIAVGQVERAGLQVLSESVEGDLHMAASADGIRIVYLQGHPEYDRESLLKEYKREVLRYLDGQLPSIPPAPENYLRSASAHRIERYIDEAIVAADAGRPAPPFPEDEVVPALDNTWTDTGKAVFNNWLGLIYRLTDVERGVPFMPDLDPEDPLGLRASAATT